jgi:hypothetical protein
MPSLAQHHSNNLVKLLLLGDAKSGKTSSLVSLVRANYKLRILDMDNLLDPLKYQIMSHCPDKIDNVEYRSLRDDYKVTATGTVVDGKPKCWIDSLKMLNNWSYTDSITGEVIELGPPATWPDDTILVIDSLSRWCDAAMEFHRSMTPVGKGGQADGRAIYGNAQDDVEKQLASLTSPNFRCNVIVICHGVYMTLDDGTTKIFPQGIGQKLSPKIPTYFPNYIRYIQKADKRTIQLTSNQMISLANGRPDAMPTELPTDTGLAEFFAILHGGTVAKSEPTPVAKPKSLTLRRA